jgi:hypothetical protein
MNLGASALINIVMPAQQEQVPAAAALQKVKTGNNRRKHDG